MIEGRVVYIVTSCDGALIGCPRCAVENTNEDVYVAAKHVIIYDVTTYSNADGAGAPNENVSQCKAYLAK